MESSNLLCYNFPKLNKNNDTTDGAVFELAPVSE